MVYSAPGFHSGMARVWSVSSNRRRCSQVTNNDALEMLIDHVGDLFDFYAGNPAEVACLALGDRRPQ